MSRRGPSSMDILRWPESPADVSSSPLPPVRISATNDSSAFMGTYDTPTNRPTIRTFQPAGGLSSIQFGANLTPEEAEALQKRRPGSESKKKEMSGSGIFSTETGSDATSPIPPEKCMVRVQQPAGGVSHISFGGGEEAELASAGRSLRKPVTIPEVAKQRELTGTLEAEAEDSLAVRRPCSAAKAKELVGSNIFGPPPDMPPRCLGRHYSEQGDDSVSSPLPALQQTPEVKIPEISTKRTSVKVSNPAGGRSQISFGEEMVDDLSARKVHDQKMAELSGNNIFHSEPAKASPEKNTKHLSAAKLKEMTGSDIFKDEKPAIRECLGGIRQAPGGDSSLTLV